MMQWLLFVRPLDTESTTQYGTAVKEALLATEWSIQPSRVIVIKTPLCTGKRFMHSLGRGRSNSNGDRREQCIQTVQELVTFDALGFPGGRGHPFAGSPHSGDAASPKEYKGPLGQKGADSFCGKSENNTSGRLSLPEE